MTTCPCFERIERATDGKPQISKPESKRILYTRTSLSSSAITTSSIAEQAIPKTCAQNAASFMNCTVISFEYDK